MTLPLSLSGHLDACSLNLRVLSQEQGLIVCVQQLTRGPDVFLEVWMRMLLPRKSFHPIVPKLCDAGALNIR